MSRKSKKTTKLAGAGLVAAGVGAGAYFLYKWLEANRKGVDAGGGLYDTAGTGEGILGTILQNQTTDAESKVHGSSQIAEVVSLKEELNQKNIDKVATSKDLTQIQTDIELLAPKLAYAKEHYYSAVSTRDSIQKQITVLIDKASWSQKESQKVNNTFGVFAYNQYNDLMEESEKFTNQAKDLQPKLDYWEDQVNRRGQVFTTYQNQMSALLDNENTYRIALDVLDDAIVELSSDIDALERVVTP